MEFILDEKYDRKVKPIKYIIKNGCWICTSHSKLKTGYNRLKRNGKEIYMHRYIYELYYGEIGKYHVLHTCDNPSCINPKHLKLGTHQENMSEKKERNRAKGINKNNTFGLGSKRSEEFRKKLSESRKGDGNPNHRTKKKKL